MNRGKTRLGTERRRERKMDELGIRALTTPAWPTAAAGTTAACACACATTWWTILQRRKGKFRRSTVTQRTPHSN
jgi:hypothetical protein